MTLTKKHGYITKLLTIVIMASLFLVSFKIASAGEFLQQHNNTIADDQSNTAPSGLVFCPSEDINVMTVISIAGDTSAYCYVWDNSTSYTYGSPLATGTFSSNNCSISLALTGGNCYMFAGDSDVSSFNEKYTLNYTQPVADSKGTWAEGVSSDSGKTTMTHFDSYGFTIKGLVLNTPNATKISQYEFENDWTDSADSNDLTSSGASFSSSVYAFGAYSSYFDGSSYAEKSSPTIDFGNYNFSTSLWYYATEYPADTKAKFMLSFGDSVDWAKMFGLAIANVSSTYVYQLQCNGITPISSPIPLLTNQWEFVVVTYNTDANTYSFYRNGVYIGNTTVCGVTDINPNVLDIGKHVQGAISWIENYVGYIDKAIIWNATLQQEDVTTLYNEYIPPAPTTPSFNNITIASASNDISFTFNITNAYDYILLYRDNVLLYNSSLLFYNDTGLVDDTNYNYNISVAYNDILYDERNFDVKTSYVSTIDIPLTMLHSVFNDTCGSANIPGGSIFFTPDVPVMVYKVRFGSISILPTYDSRVELADVLTSDVLATTRIYHGQNDRDDGGANVTFNQTVDLLRNRTYRITPTAYLWEMLGCTRPITDSWNTNIPGDYAVYEFTIFGQFLPYIDIVSLSASAISYDRFTLNWNTSGNYSYSLVYINDALFYNDTNKSYTATGLNALTLYNVNVTVIYNDILQDSLVITPTTTACIEDWGGYTTSCTNNQQILYYLDANSCGTYTNLPLNNGTISTCYVPSHTTGEVVGVIVDFGVEYGIVMISMTGLIALVMLGVWAIKKI